MSLCLNSTGEFREAIRQTTYAIKLDPKASKALYIRAVAAKNIEDFSQAAKDIKAAYDLDPNNAAIKNEYKAIAAGKKAYQE